ncbi:hypothetical protein CR513_15807, partial [Mucuna pruriens]
MTWLSIAEDSQTRISHGLTSVGGGGEILHPPLFRDTRRRALEEDSSSLEKDHLKGTRMGTIELRSLIQLQHRAESIFLTFDDLRIETVEIELAGLQRQSKRKRKELDSREDEKSRETPKEKGLRELEWSQALLEEEELIAALAEVRSKEEDARGHLRQLQEQISLLKTEVVKYKLHNEYLEKRRRQRLAELTEEKRKAADWGLQANTAIQRLKEQAY